MCPLTQPSLTPSLSLIPSLTPLPPYPLPPYALVVYPECAKYPLTASGGGIAHASPLARDFCERVLQHMVLREYFEEENVDNARLVGTWCR